MLSAQRSPAVTIRRVRVVSEPLSVTCGATLACTDVDLGAARYVRCLPRTKLPDLLLPGADCSVLATGSSVKLQRGDGTNRVTTPSTSAPRTIRDIVAASMAWDRATPHVEYEAVQEEVSRALRSRPRWSRLMPRPSRVWRVPVAVVRPDENSESAQ